MQKALTEIIRGLKEPSVTEMVSVLSVTVTPDLKTAKAFVSIFGDKAKIETTFAGLNKSSGFIRSALAKRFSHMHTVPQVTFVMDTTADYAEKINNIIDNINK